jgi:hypothetical protein
MPKKTFTAGEVLTASDVNTFLMDQSVMSFAGTAARGSAIGTATEGMLTYLEDSNSYQSWDGSGWVGLVPQSGNAIINGAFEINQRNFTSTTSSAIYTFDRFRTTVGGDGSSTYTAQNFTPGTAPLSTIEGTNFLRIVTASQTVAGSFTDIRQRIEDVRNFAGQTATLSFFAKAASGTPKVAVEFQQGFGTGGSSSVFIYGGQVTLSTSWQRYSLTVNLPSITGKTIGTGYTDLTVELIVSAGSDFNARTGSLGIQSNTFDIWGVQLEAGPVATPFRRNANSLQGELAACQRYYFRTSAINPFSVIGGAGYTTSTTNTTASVSAPVTMRALPTSVDFSQIAVQDSASGVIAVTSVTIDANQSSPQFITTNNTSVGLTAGRFARQIANNNAAAFLGFSAEL